MLPGRYPNQHGARMTRMSVEYRYRDAAAHEAEERLRTPSEKRVAGANMIAFQRVVIQELRSGREALNITIVALQEENARLRLKTEDLEQRIEGLENDILEARDYD